MKRDFDLIRNLLFYFESKEDDRPEQCPDIEGYSEVEIMYNLRLMDEAGLLNCQRLRTKDSERILRVAAGSLTWAGHDFLDASRNSNIWN